MEMSQELLLYTKDVLTHARWVGTEMQQVKPPLKRPVPMYASLESMARALVRPLKATVWSVRMATFVNETV